MNNILEFIAFFLIVVSVISVVAVFRASSTKPDVDPAELHVLMAELEFYRKTHLDWASYFEKNPDKEQSYVATGEWDNVAEHRRVARVYDRVLSILKQIASTERKIAA
jgi:hypothetical protein